MDDHIYWWMMGTMTRCWSFAQWKTCRGIDILHIGFQSGGGVFCVQSPLNSSPQLPSIHTRLHKKVIILVSSRSLVFCLYLRSRPYHCIAQTWMLWQWCYISVTVVECMGYWEQGRRHRRTWGTCPSSFQRWRGLGGQENPTGQTRKCSLYFSTFSAYTWLKDLTVTD